VRQTVLSRVPGKPALLTVALMVCVGSGAAAAQSGSIAARQPDVAPHKIEEFSGVWTYNADESVNAATGRPELGPRSATQRNPGAARTGGAPASSGGAGPTSDGRVAPPAGIAPSGTGAGGGRDSFTRGSSVGPTADMVQQSRDLARDLLEVPESLTIHVAKDGVSFTDDLERSRTYTTSGTKQRYQLGASRFDAAMAWDGSQLQKRIEGAYGFKMTETYLLSADGRRLFVIVRVGDRKKDDPVVGFNRVYDRAE
jgi:hypothetical protein